MTAAVLDNLKADMPPAGLRSEALGSIGSHLPALDGVRGIAVLQVVLMHYFVAARPSASTLSKVLTQLPALFPSGVDLFFVLSGFLITGILLDARGRTKYFSNFYARRVLRIFPLYYGVLAVIFVPMMLLIQAGIDANPVDIGMVRAQGWLWSYLTNYAFGILHVQNGSAYFAFAHFWTLATEEQFYVVWPLIVFLCPPRVIARICVVGLIATLALRTFCVVRQYGDVLFWMLRGDGLLVGALLACAMRSGFDPARYQVVARRSLPWLGALSAAFISLGYFSPKFPQYEVAMRNGSFFATIPSVAFGGALVIVALGASRGSAARRLLEHPKLVLFGKLSYGLYIYHYLFEGLLKEYLLEGFLWRISKSLVMLPIFVIVAGGLALGLAWLSWNCYEKQVLKLKRYFA